MTLQWYVISDSETGRCLMEGFMLPSVVAQHICRLERQDYRVTVRRRPGQSVVLYATPEHKEGEGLSC